MSPEANGTSTSYLKPNKCSCGGVAIRAIIARLGCSDRINSLASPALNQYRKSSNVFYSIPSVDCIFLPLPFTSAEELSKFFAETLAKKLSEDYDNLEYVAVCVNEGIGQGAMYRKDL